MKISVVSVLLSITQRGLQLTTGKCGIEANAAEGRLSLFAIHIVLMLSAEHWWDLSKSKIKASESTSKFHFLGKNTML